MLNQTAIRTMAALSAIPLEYTTFSGDPVFGIVAMANLTFCILLITVLRLIDTMKGNKQNRTYFRLSANRASGLLLPVAFSAMSGSIMGCVFSSCVTLFLLPALLATFFNRIDAGRFKLLWTIGHLLGTSFWFATVIFTFFQF
jgi:hypothetical protein